MCVSSHGPGRPVNAQRPLGWWLVARHTGEPLAVLHRVLKEVAAHHVARVSRAPALLAARQRRPR